MNLSNNPSFAKTEFIDNKRILITLIATMIAITLIYQSRPFLDDLQFAWISVPTYAILPGAITAYKNIIKQKHFSFLL